MNFSDVTSLVLCRVSKQFDMGKILMKLVSMGALVGGEVQGLRDSGLFPGTLGEAYICTDRWR